ncbi:hypothetical protein BIU82_03965 [Arthrobacter sp. SW1]|uniref:hypothetical protein n=1 Tax=Arthrobacter sp. SW1 TaxID=1920889 RepID=UPI000877CB28|nr:hypothetical protein [Arthrobacter sp. SW1]OFI38488.1 hypothetical protein BIU82_03965 [Arthrobacter sp. SW1]
MAKESFAQRFMRATGRLRIIFGPAHTSSLDHEMTEANQALLRQRQVETLQWETKRRADGSSYVVPKDPGDRSLR